MSALQPWVMAAHADTVGADERDRIARSAEGTVVAHSVIVLGACHRVQLYGFDEYVRWLEGRR